MLNDFFMRTAISLSKSRGLRKGGWFKDTFGDTACAASRFSVVSRSRPKKNHTNILSKLLWMKVNRADGYIIHHGISIS